MKSRSVQRLWFIFGFFILIAFILLARLYHIQIVLGNEYSDRADQQYVRTTSDLYDRGSVFFKDKDERLVSAATLKTGYTVVIDPGSIDEPEDVYNRLSAFIPLAEEEFLARAGKKDDPYEEVAKRVEPEVAGAIDESNIPGVSVYKDRWRFYPGHTLAAQTIGFVAYDENDLTGVYGIERYYNDVLSREGGGLYVNFFAEIFSNLNKTLFHGAEGRLGDIVTSLEPSVQLFLEKELTDLHASWGSTLTAGIIMNPENGEIYALAVTPTFDINNFQEEKDISIFQNPLIENVYEMGSIIKPLTMAAGIDANAVSATTTYTDKGSIDLDGFTIWNFDKESRGVVNMQEVLNQSLNTGAAFVVSRMGNDVFADYMRAYGIGEETGIDLPNESAGLADNLESPRDVEYATASFGQGIALTPIATVRALATLANGGVLVTPHVATEIKYRTGLSKKISFNDGERVLKPETVESITQMLVRVVDHALLEGRIKREHHSVAAKTGTAQIAKAGERGYYDDRSLHTFFGYFPAYEPRFLVFLLTLEPQGVRYASQTLTMPFNDIVSFLINYYEVPPDR